MMYWAESKVVKTVESLGKVFGEVMPLIESVIDDKTKLPVILRVLGLASGVHVPVKATEVHDRVDTMKLEAILTSARPVI
jgi:hypothetical protein